MTLKKIALRAGVAVAGAVAAYAIKRLVASFIARRSAATVPPTTEDLAEKARLGRMSRKARKQYRAARRAAEA
jgi:hypothetical protein